MMSAAYWTIMSELAREGAQLVARINNDYYNHRRFQAEFQLKQEKNVFCDWAWQLTSRPL